MYFTSGVFILEKEDKILSVMGLMTAVLCLPQE